MARMAARRKCCAWAVLILVPLVVGAGEEKLEPLEGHPLRCPSRPGTKIFAAINKVNAEPELESAGKATVASYWSRIGPDGDSDRGQTVRNPLHEDVPKWTVEKEIKVDVGHFASIYMDISTRFQQESHGYWDFLGLREPPPLKAAIHMKNTIKPYYRLSSR